MPKKIISITIFVVFILAVVGLVVMLVPGERSKVFENKSAEENPKNVSLPESISPMPMIQPSSLAEGSEGGNLQKPITLMFVGDIMLSRSVGDKMKKENEWRWPFLKIAETTSQADVIFGNLEGPISDKGTNVGSIYSFRADPRVIEGLSFSGFDVLSVSNNHMLDWGREALEDTFKRLKSAGIGYSGGGMNEKEAHSALIKEVQLGDSSKFKIAFLAYCSEGSQYWAATAERSGMAWLNEQELKEDVMAAKKQADLVVVSMHSGEEYKTWPNSNQKFFSRLAIDSGADLVVGHHPHVLQPIEQYQNGYIAYSLGNFVFDQTFSPQTKESAILKAVVENGKIQSVTQLKAEISNDFQVFLK